MADRIARWAAYGLGLGLLPLLVAWVVRAYYLARPPAGVELLGGGDALLVVAGWAAAALFDSRDAESGAARAFVTIVSVLLATASVVAYACLTADSVTGRVQTRAQARWMTTGSLWGLGIAAAVSTGAAALRRPEPKEQSR
ncbi:MAG TPA: hypothetical protein VNA20_00970 [Frankiaceae bacterium]|nr:hypothetical protein [Frankiaceae bacterium]